MQLWKMLQGFMTMPSKFCSLQCCVFSEHSACTGMSNKQFLCRHS